MNGHVSRKLPEMKYVIAFGLAIMVVLASAAAYVYYGLTHRPDLSSFVALTAAPDINRNAPLRVTFLGVSTLVFDDGSTAILDEQVDPVLAPRARVKMEVMLLQRALDVRVDGIIGIETRMAIAQAADTIKRLKEHL